MQITSWNVNGLRSINKNNSLTDYIKKHNPDILCIQETKIDATKEKDPKFTIDGYHTYFNSSKIKKGHAGVLVYTKIKPLSIEKNIGVKRFDDEGRCLKLTFPHFILFNFYIPHGKRDKADIPYKLEVYKKLVKILKKINDKPVILAGDFNIAQSEIDVYNAKQNYKNTMFTEAERKQISEIINSGYTDTFRFKHPNSKEYTWWPYMNNLRERNIGWRIDYLFVTKCLEKSVKDSFIQGEVLGGDHCPVGLDIGV